MASWSVCAKARNEWGTLVWMNHGKHEKQIPCGNDSKKSKSKNKNRPPVRAGPTLLPLVNHDVGLVAAGIVQGNRQCVQIGRQGNVLGTRHFSIVFMGDHEIVLVHTPSRSGRAFLGVGSVGGVVLAVKLYIPRAVLGGSYEGEAVAFIGLHLHR